MRNTILIAALVLVAGFAAAHAAAPATATKQAGTPAAAPAASKPKAVRAYVVIFDFASDQGDSGKQIADSVRLRLARHEDLEVIDGITTAEASGPMGADTPGEKIAALMDRLAVNYAVWGSVRKDGQRVQADVRCLDMTDPAAGKGVEQSRTFTDSAERARGEIARQIVEVVAGAEEWIPPQYGDEPEPLPKDFGPPVNANGDFEQGSAHWDAPDNAGTFIEAGPAGRGKILRVRTDLERDPWLEYVRNIRLGLADPAKPPTIKRDTSYNSVAGLEGVHYRGEWIKAAPLTRYWLTCDHKGLGGAKVFVKGYRDTSADADGLPELSMVERKLAPEAFAKMPRDQQIKLIAADAAAHPERYRRECYRWYLNCKDSHNDWKHFAAPFPPRGGLPKDVEWLQIQIYSYWPPGEYLWDNVRLYKDPAQKAPAAEEPARTPNFGKTSTKDSG